MFITTGVLMLLFVTYQLWWTNVRAHPQANGAASNLQHDWASGADKGARDVLARAGLRDPAHPQAGRVVPIAEGVSNTKVLDKGMVGHYGEGR